MFEINRSIVKHKNQIWSCFRTQNLFNFDSVSYICELSEDLGILTKKRLYSENGNSAFEDVRLFSYGDDVLALYTFLPMTGKKKWNWDFTVGLGKIDLHCGLIRDQLSLRQVATRQQEKNWIPYTYQGQLYLITDFHPYLRVVKMNQDTGIFVPEVIFLSGNQTTPWSYGEIRGGTPLHANPNSGEKWLYGFVHSSQYSTRGFYRYYFYTIVRFHPELMIFEYCPEPLPVARPPMDEDYLRRWMISSNQGLCVVFPMGIIADDQGLLLSLGIDDITNEFVKFDWKSILGYFNTND